MSDSVLVVTREHLSKAMESAQAAGLLVLAHVENARTADGWASEVACAENAAAALKPGGQARAAHSRKGLSNPSRVGLAEE